MKRLMLLLAFLISIGTSAFGQEGGSTSSTSVTINLTPSEEGGTKTLATELGDNVNAITNLTVIGPLAIEDFVTMKSMKMLQVLDMSQVSALPSVEYWPNTPDVFVQYLPVEAFKNKQTLQSIVLPNCVEVIGKEAFSGCSNLFTVDFSQATGLIEIGESAFVGCPFQVLNLSGYTSLVAIKEEAFSNCSNLLSVDFSACEYLQQIGGSAFSSCTSLQTVNLSGCTRLEKLNYRTFQGNDALKSVKVENCVALESIGMSVFEGCFSLNDFDFSKLIALKTIDYWAFNGTALEGDILFPASLNKVGNGAFQECKKITSLDFHNCAIIDFSDYAPFNRCIGVQKLDFGRCTSLNSLDINGLFGGECPSLQEIIIDNDYYTAVDGVLYVVDMATLMYYPAGKKATEFSIPSTVLTIQSSAFPYNKNLKQLTIPESVKSIQPDAFLRQESWGPYPIYTVIMEAATPIGLSSNIGLNSAIIYVPEGALNAYKEAAIWKDYTLIETGAEGKTVALDAAGSLGAKLSGVDLGTIQELTITGPMNASDFEVIKQMTLLTKVDLGEASMEGNKLPNYAFSGLSYLKEVILPDEVKEIGDYVFSGKRNLEKVNLPVNLESIGTEAFYYCERMPGIDLSLSTHLREIGAFAFQGCGAISTDLKLPSSLEHIGHNAFGGTGVTSVDFSNTILNRIESNAFSDCEITGNLSFPATLTFIGDNAFNAATPNSIKLKSAEMVRLGGTDVFKAAKGTTCKVYVPKGLEAAYKADTYWFPFRDNIVDTGYLVNVTSNNGNYGSVTGGGAYDEAETVVLTAQTYHIDSGWYQGLASFAGWYENNQKVSADLTYSFVMDEKDHNIEAKFFIPLDMIDGNELITDDNKYDGQNVRVWYNARWTIQGDNIWKPNEFMVDRNASMLVESPVEPQSVNMYWERYSSNWQFVSFPYDLKVSDIQMDGCQFVVREYDGDARASKGMGESWKQLSASDVMQANKGYILRSNRALASSSETYNSSIDDMSALFNRQAVTIPLEKHPSTLPADANWNLVGNPFPCYFSVEQLFRDGLDGTVTVWSDDIQNYAYYTQDDADAYLTPLTAFFIQHGGSTSSVTFKPEGRAATLPTTRAAVADLRSDTGREVINLQLANDSLSDKTRVVFNEAASTDYELGRDAAKFSSMNNNAPSLYTLDAQNQQLAINERPIGNGVVRLGCYIGVKGSYTLSAKEQLASDLYLYDAETGASCNLRETNYTFTAEAGVCNNRFELRTALKGTGVETIEGFSWQVVSNQLQLNGLPIGATVSLFDANGRMRFTGDAATAAAGIALPQSGIYYLIIRTAEGVSSTVSIKR